MTKKAIKISGINQVYAVIGGFHLIDAKYERIQYTVSALKEIGIKKVYTGHCTGLRAEKAFADVLRKDFEKLHSGKIMFSKHYLHKNNSFLFNIHSSSSPVTSQFIPDFFIVFQVNSQKLSRPLHLLTFLNY